MRTFFTFILFAIVFTHTAYAQYDYPGNNSEIQESIDKYSKKIEENPNNTYAYARLADAYFQQQDNESITKAIKILNDLLEIDPNYEGALYRRGYCKIFLEDYQGACKDWKNSVKLGFNPKEGFNNNDLIYGVRMLCGDEEAEALAAYK